MCFVKNKGLILFLVVVVSITIISSVSTKKYDEANKSINDSYVSLNLR
ncbi:MAG: hypothetical protein Q4E75_05190 [bacterium]|nr:hypothetical protein [bacterium]